MTASAVTTKHTTKTISSWSWKTTVEGAVPAGASFTSADSQVDVTAGLDTFYRDTPGFRVYAAGLTSRGAKQLAEFLIGLVPEMERVERERGES